MPSRLYSGRAVLLGLTAVLLAACGGTVAPTVAEHVQPATQLPRVADAEQPEAGQETPAINGVMEEETPAEEVKMTDVAAELIDKAKSDQVEMTLTGTMLARKVKKGKYVEGVQVIDPDSKGYDDLQKKADQLYKKTIEQLAGGKK